MSSRTDVFGVVEVPRGEMKKALKRPFLGMYFVIERGDDVDVVLRERSLKQIGLVKSVYDKVRRIWSFHLVLHDDDWINADYATLYSFVEQVAAVENHAFLAVRESMANEPNCLICVTEGRARHILVYDNAPANSEDDKGPPQSRFEFVTHEKVAELIRELNWLPAIELLAWAKADPLD